MGSSGTPLWPSKGNSFVLVLADTNQSILPCDGGDPSVAVFMLVTARNEAALLPGVAASAANAALSPPAFQNSAPGPGRRIPGVGSPLLLRLSPGKSLSFLPPGNPRASCWVDFLPPGGLPAVRCRATLRVAGGCEKTLY